MLHKHNNFSLIFQTYFDGTSVDIFSVTYFEIAVEFKSRAMLRSSLLCFVILHTEKYCDG